MRGRGREAELGARGRNRTVTPLSGPGILSPSRLLSQTRAKACFSMACQILGLDNQPNKTNEDWSQERRCMATRASRALMFLGAF